MNEPPEITAAPGIDIELRGWIALCDLEITPSIARAELSSLGVDIGEWDDKEREFSNCIITLTALRNLDPLWGRYIWGCNHE